MANIKKSFNFRNGVQVDDDNLKVSATGLVGIGTTVPTEALDVRGNLVVSGVSSAVTLQAGVATITTLNPTEIIGAGVSIKSGIITASSGIITFFGDGINLLNLPTSQWEDTIVGAGVSSIYNTGGNVGIATTAAIFTLQVGNDVNSGQKGVGISSFGDIKASGIITATTFSGNLDGNVTGNLTGNVTGNVTGNITGSTIISGNVDLNADIDVDGHTELDNLNVSGISTLQRTTVNGHLDVVGQTTLDFVNVSAGSTFAGNIDANGNIDVDGLAELDDVNVSGASTFFGRIEGGMTNNVIPFLYGNLASLPNASDYHGAFAHVHSEGAAYFAHAGQWVEIVNKESDGRIGTGIEICNFGNINSGILTATLVNTNSIGVGTISDAADIHVRKEIDSEIQVTSDNGVASVSVGREPGGANTNNAEFRYGGGSGFTYSSAQSLDILNYGTGNFNYHLSANNPGGVQGDFHWHKGSNNVRLMTLTNTGRLGIGVTEPTDELDIVGGATVSGNVVVGNNLTVSGNIVGNVQGTLTGNVAGTLAGNTNTTVGISTLNNLSIAGIATAARLRANNFAIGQDPNTELLSIFVSNANKIIVNDVGQIGISTTTVLPGVTISASTANMSISQIGVGVTQFSSGSVDFSTAGGPTLAARRYMVPPKATTTERNNFTGLVSGAMIYNTSLNKLQVYNGSAWETVTSS